LVILSSVFAGNKKAAVLGDGTAAPGSLTPARFSGCGRSGARVLKRRGPPGHHHGRGVDVVFALHRLPW